MDASVSYCKEAKAIVMTDAYLRNDCICHHDACGDVSNARLENCCQTLPVVATVAPNMIVVHHLSSSRSQRIIWLLEELGVQYEVKRYERMSNMLAPPELKKIHPLGKSPVITDGDVIVAESGEMPCIHTCMLQGLRCEYPLKLFRPNYRRYCGVPCGHIRQWSSHTATKCETGPPQIHLLAALF